MGIEILVPKLLLIDRDPQVIETMIASHLGQAQHVDTGKVVTPVVTPALALAEPVRDVGAALYRKRH
jgi:hypothetical protein